MNSNVLDNTLKNKTVLVTGGAGFIGSHLIDLFVKKYKNTKFINFDVITYAANLDNVKHLEAYNNYLFIKGDICDEKFVNQVFIEHCIDGVIHLAAESHVDNSIESPDVFIKTNVLGTHNLLHSAYKLWSGPNKEQFKHAKFLHISTDEVYGHLGDTGYFTEQTPYSPNSPYSASKASSDMLVKSYFRTYGLPIVITNCSNNFGPMQHDEKLIPTIIRKALNEQSIPIYGSGKNIRDWIYVLDHCIGVETVFVLGKIGESYNIGANNELTNLDMAYKICDMLDKMKPRESGKYSDLISFVKDRAGHDFRYAIDNTKITKNLGWSQTYNFDQSITLTLNWYMNKYISK